MIKALAQQPDGRKLLLLGLSFENLDLFRAHPGKSFIHIDGKEMGLPLDVMLICEKTEADMLEALKGWITEDTKIMQGTPHART